MTPTMTNLETALVPVRVVSLGDGPKVLYLHDLLFDAPTAEGEVSRFAWMLSESTAVTVPALPGFLDINELESLHSVEDYVFLLLDLLEELRLEEVHVVGAGFGGWLAAELAVRRSDLISSVALVNALGLRVEGHPTARYFDACAPDPLGGKRAVRALLFADPEGDIAVEMLPDVLDLSQATRFFTHVHAVARIGWEPPAFYDLALKDRLGRIRVPTTVVWGAQNSLVDVAHGETYANGILRSKLTVVEGAGHMITVEKPKETLGLVLGGIR